MEDDLMESFKRNVAEQKDVALAKCWLRQQKSSDIQTFKEDFDFAFCEDKKPLLLQELADRQRKKRLIQMLWGVIIAVIVAVLGAAAVMFFGLNESR